MGNCTKLPRSNSDENIHNVREPAARNQAQPAPNPVAYPYNQNYPYHNQSAPNNPRNQPGVNYYPNQPAPLGYPPPQYPQPPQYAQHPQNPQYPQYPRYPQHQQYPPPANMGNMISMPLNYRQQPTDQMKVNGSKAISRLFRIKDDRIHLELNSDTLHWINFQYSSKFKSVATVYFLAREVFNKQQNVMSFYKDPAIQPNPHQFELEPSNLGEFSRQCKVMLNGLNKSILEFTDRCTYPIIIEISCKDLNTNETQVLISYFKIAHEHETFEASIFKQVIKIKDNYLTLQSLYGASGEQEESECLICLTELRIIAVLPCRHVCYCEGCLVEVKKKSKIDCPVCRSRVDAFLSVVKHS